MSDYDPEEALRELTKGTITTTVIIGVLILLTLIATVITGSCGSA